MFVVLAELLIIRKPFLVVPRLYPQFRIGAAHLAPMEPLGFGAKKAIRKMPLNVTILDYLR